jgi:hypothetical protein
MLGRRTASMSAVEYNLNRGLYFVGGLVDKLHLFKLPKLCDCKGPHEPRTSCVWLSSRRDETGMDTGRESQASTDVEN